MTNKELIQRLLDLPLEANVHYLIPANYEQGAQKSPIEDLYTDAAGRIILET